MPKYHMTMTQKTTWEFDVEADDYDSAYRQTFDWGRDEMIENEITDNVWYIDIDELED
jgi:hypothetical protein